MKKILLALLLLTLMVNIVPAIKATCYRDGQEVDSGTTGDINSSVKDSIVPSVVGEIYNANGEKIRENGISIKATCYRDGQEVDSGTTVSRDVSQWYSLAFWPKMKCAPGDYVTIEASKDNRIGFNSSIFDSE